MKRIYLDYAATTPISKRVADAMRDFELTNFGNPSSVHRDGQNARGAIDFARAKIADFLHAKPQEIIFTSGATEANNLAILGVINQALKKGIKPHVVTTYLEHHSVFNTVEELANKKIIEATFIKPESNGKIPAEKILKALKENTVLVSAIFVCNEIGTVLPVREIGRGLAGLNIIFHVDAVQAAKFYNCHVEKIGCDLLTISAHKIQGPKGIGALYVKSGTKLEPIIQGGSQEYGLRPGTQNTSGIIGFAQAIEDLGDLETREKRNQNLRKLKESLTKSLLKIKQVKLNGCLDLEFAPDIISLNVAGVDQESLMTLLDIQGISASTGSACVSGSNEISHVISALGTNIKDGATLRLSISHISKPTELTRAGRIIANVIRQLSH